MEKGEWVGGGEAETQQDERIKAAVEVEDKMAEKVMEKRWWEEHRERKERAEELGAKRRGGGGLRGGRWRRGEGGCCSLRGCKGRRWTRLALHLVHGGLAGWSPWKPPPPASAGGGETSQR